MLEFSIGLLLGSLLFTSALYHYIKTLKEQRDHAWADYDRLIELLLENRKENRSEENPKKTTTNIHRSDG